MSKYFTCPNCGADVPLKALACPQCGSDRETGWSEAAQYAHLLPDKGEGEIDASQSKTWQKYSMAAIAFVVIVAILIAGGLAWTLYLIPFIALAGGIAYYATRQSASSSSGLEKQLYRQLVARAGGDKKIVDRLIDYERQRHPDSNRLQLLQNAIYRWDRDRR